MHSYKNNIYIFFVLQYASLKVKRGGFPLLINFVGNINFSFTLLLFSIVSM